MINKFLYNQCQHFMLLRKKIENLIFNKNNLNKAEQLIMLVVLSIFLSNDILNLFDVYNAYS